MAAGLDWQAPLSPRLPRAVLPPRDSQEDPHTFTSWFSGSHVGRILWQPPSPTTHHAGDRAHQAMPTRRSPPGWRVSRTEMPGLDLSILITTFRTTTDDTAGQPHSLHRHHSSPPSRQPPTQPSAPPLPKSTLPPASPPTRSPPSSPPHPAVTTTSTPLPPWLPQHHTTLTPRHLEPVQEPS